MLRTLKSVLVVALAGLWAAGTGLPAAAQPLVCKTDPTVRAQLAREAAAQVRALQKLHGERDVAPRTQAVFARLVDALAPADARRSELRWSLSGYGSEALNAHAMHNGEVVVSLGLDAPTLPEELVAAALAHEIAHVVLAHGVEQSCYAALFPSTAPPLPRPGGPLPEIWSSGEGPVHGVRVLMHAHELEADLKAVQLLRAAGYADHSMSRLLELLAARQQASRRAPRGSHPDHRLRIAKVREAELALATTAPARPASAASAHADDGP